MQQLAPYSVKVFDAVTQGGQYRRIAEVTVNQLDEKDPVLKIHRGDIGIANSSVALDYNPRAIGECFVVVWDGNAQTPSFRFDGYPDTPFKFRIETSYI